MVSVSGQGKQMSSSSASQQASASRRSTPTASSKRSAKSHQGQRKRQRLQESPNHLREPSEPLSVPALATERIDAEIEGGEAHNEALDHVVMAIDIKDRDTVGCAYYVAREQSLRCMEDVDGGGKAVLEILKLEIQPTVLLISSRIELEDDKNGLLHSARHVSVLESDEHPLPYRLEFRPNLEFNYDGALNKLASLKAFGNTAEDIQFLIPGESSNFEPGQDPDDVGTTNRQGRLLQVSACVVMESKVSVGCLGAVITWINSKRASEYLHDDPDAQLAYRVTEMTMFSLKDTMLVNPDTLLSLQIIQPESHPNAFNQGPGTTGSKESLSIFGLFQYLARTPHGRTRLRRYFLRPSLDLDVINTRLDFVSVFVQPHNDVPLNKLSKSLSRIKNMHTIVTLLHKGVNSGNRKLGGLKSGVWASLLEFCYHTIDIAESLKEVLGAERIPLRARAMDILDTNQLQRIGKMIHDVVDLEASIEQHRTVAKHGIDEKLDEIKNVYDGMEELLSQVAIEIGRSIPAYIKLNVIYFPQLGFHITVPVNEDTGHAVYDGGAENWRRMFTTQNQVYFKNAHMHEMDERLGDLYAMICDIEIEISHELAQKVLQDEELLIAASDICGELDAHLALAHGALQYKLTRPCVTENSIIDIREGRHLLQEMCVASYVPNDTYLVGGTVDNDPATTPRQADGPSMLLLTGPNYSGKSVYMKSVAQTIYLSHIGSFVPCTSAKIGLTDKILTRITTRETVSRNQSAFMMELQQVAMALSQCTRRSLVVIDEFGKGTEGCDGAGLAAGVVRYLLDRPEGERPKALVATHFHEIFEVDEDLERHENVGMVHMAVHVDRNPQHQLGQHETEVTYLYDLLPGRSSLSYGIQCAAMNGIPALIVRRARQLADLAVKGEDLVRVCARVTEEEQRDFAKAEETAREFVMMDLEKGRVESLVERLGRILDVTEEESAETETETQTETDGRSETVENLSRD